MSYDPGPTIPPMDVMVTGPVECIQCGHFFWRKASIINKVCAVCTDLCNSAVGITDAIPGVDTTIDELRLVIEAQRLIIEELRAPKMEFKPGCAGYGHDYNQRLPLIP